MYLLEEKPMGDFSPRKSFQMKMKNNGSSISLLTVDSFSRQSFSYSKLPQEPLKLTVIKLDGTSFEIEMVKTGTVAQLKQAVEAVFSHLPKDGSRRVSWPFVWGHFCLCYKEHKLLNDVDEIGSYGIQDGDELHFIRHVLSSQNTAKEGSEKEDLGSDEPTISGASEGRHPRSQELDKYKERDVHKQQDVHIDNENSQLATSYRNKWASLFGGWFTYHKLQSSDQETEENSSNPCRFSLSSLASPKDTADLQRKT